MSGRAAWTGARIGRELAAHGLASTAGADPHCADLQRGIALTAKRFGVQLT